MPSMITFLSDYWPANETKVALLGGVHQGRNGAILTGKDEPVTLN